MPKAESNKNLISINDLSDKDIEFIFKRAENYLAANRSDHKYHDVLKDKMLFNVFFENSTRTRVSFEIAARRMGCDVVNVDITNSSIAKGESAKDTFQTLNAMKPDFMVVRHGEDGFVAEVSKYINCPIINAGNGVHEHPTQALLDAFTIMQNKGEIRGLTVAICGDILHSRVAGSNILLLKRLGAKIRLIGPKEFLPKQFDVHGVELYHDMEIGLKGVDVVMMLRVQKERMKDCEVPSFEEYHDRFGLNHERLALANEDAIVLHPGPVNREVEMDGKLVDDESRCMILKQVEAGVAVRQAILLRSSS